MHHCRVQISVSTEYPQCTPVSVWNGKWSFYMKKKMNESEDGKKRRSAQLQERENLRTKEKKAKCEKVKEEKEEEGYPTGCVQFIQ